MVSLAQNRQKIWYAEFAGYTDAVDDQGYKTGEKIKSYTDPKPFLIYVAPSRGDTVNMPFGLSRDYTNVMSTNDLSCPITEESVLWIGISPYSTEYPIANVPHNYTVERVAKGLNSILYAVKRVEVSNGTQSAVYSA